jgi:hypothetical protein
MVLIEPSIGTFIGMSLHPRRSTPADYKSETTAQ